MVSKPHLYAKKGYLEGEQHYLGDLLAMVITPPETNMEPENDGSQKESPLQGVHFPVTANQGNALIKEHGCDEEQPIITHPS